MTNTIQLLTSDILYDVNRQLKSKVKFLLYDKGFDVRTNPDYNRIRLVIPEHYDHWNELYLDGVLILRWSKFAFKQDGNSLVCSFNYEEV